MDASRKSAAIGGVLLAFTSAACGSSGGGSDVNSIADSEAAALCHFIFHCCTPADRANTNSPLSFANTEQQLDFADESDCGTKLGIAGQVTLQPFQASVVDKRMTYSQTAAQACLTALQTAASSCDPTGANLALNGNGTTGNPGACTVSTFFAGTVGANGACTMTADCASSTGATCQQSLANVPDGGVPPIVTGGNCVALPGAGMPCPNFICAPGLCCGPGTGNADTCMAYVAEGAACQAGGSCGTGACDTSKDYCDQTAANPVCAALIANGQMCNPNNFGADCLSGNCDSVTSLCTGPAMTATAALEVCTGNPDGL